MPSVLQSTGGADQLWVAVTRWGVGLPVQPLPKTGPGRGQTVPRAPGPPPPPPGSCSTTTAPPLPISLNFSLRLPFSALGLLSPLLTSPWRTLHHPASWTCEHTHTHANRLSRTHRHKAAWISTDRYSGSTRSGCGCPGDLGAAWREATSWPALSPERAPALSCVFVG